MPLTTNCLLCTLFTTDQKGQNWSFAFRIPLLCMSCPNFYLYYLSVQLVRDGPNTLPNSVQLAVNTLQIVFNYFLLSCKLHVKQSKLIFLRNIGNCHSFYALLICPNDCMNVMSWNNFRWMSSVIIQSLSKVFGYIIFIMTEPPKW